jgi:hypothetical protein
LNPTFILAGGSGRAEEERRADFFRAVCICEPESVSYTVTDQHNLPGIGNRTDSL